MGLGPLVMGLVVVEAAYAWGTHTDALEYWLAQRMGRHGLPVQGPALRNLLVRPDAVKVPAWLYPAAVILAVQLTSPTLTQAHCMCVFLPLLPRPSRGVPSRTERKSRSHETALSKTNVMILRLLLPHNASSAPWSSPPSLTALPSLGKNERSSRQETHSSGVALTTKSAAQLQARMP